MVLTDDRMPHPQSSQNPRWPVSLGAQRGAGHAGRTGFPRAARHGRRCAMNATIAVGAATVLMFRNGVAALLCSEKAFEQLTDARAGIRFGTGQSPAGISHCPCGLGFKGLPGAISVWQMTTF